MRKTAFNQGICIEEAAFQLDSRLPPSLAAISRPAISEKRLSLTPNGNVRYRLKTP
jgi:hypothetical protein